MIYLVGMACKQFSSLRQVNKAAFLLLFIYYFFYKELDKRIERSVLGIWAVFC